MNTPHTTQLRAPGFSVAACLTVVAALTGTVAAQSSISVAPARVQLEDSTDHHRIVVTARYEDGTTREVTADAEIRLAAENVAQLTEDFVLVPRADGETQMLVKFGALESTVEVEVRGVAAEPPVSFTNDVIPVLTRTGCNAGACHGSASGKNGFHLSLFGYDIARDHSALTRELRGRRANPADPAASLMLTKPTRGVPHKGGKRLESGDPFYSVIHDWIQAGAADDRESAPEFVGLSLEPRELVFGGPAQRQRLVVTATYADGSDRDVTDLAILSSSNDLSFTIDSEGAVESFVPGEGYVMARFGTIALVTQVLVLDPERALTWPAELEADNEIDAAVFAKLRKQRIAPAPRCDDATFVRRVYLDILGVLPTPEQATAFCSADSPDKRADLVAELVERPEFAAVQAMQWADILRVEQRRLEDKGMFVYSEFLRRWFADGKPIDELVHALLTSTGSNFRNPAANFYLVERDPKAVAEHVAQVFMGVRVQCAQCHNHPFERWTMDDYYGFTAFFANVRSKTGEDPREKIVSMGSGRGVRHPVTRKVVQPKFLGGAVPEIAEDADPRAVLASWLTSPDNEFFASSVANRIFARFFGRGLVEPPDDVRVSNPPSHPELYRVLGRRLAESGYDVRALVRDICATHAYQTVAGGTDAPPAATLATKVVRRLTAEQLHDAIADVTGVATKLPRLPLGARSAEVAGPTGNRFLEVFGRPDRGSACTCDRRNEPTLSQALHLINGDTITEKLRDKKGRLARLLKAEASDEEILDELFAAAYSRRAEGSERERLLASVADAEDRRAAWEDVFWAVLNSREFLFTH